jgi:hypothetical protein
MPGVQANRSAAILALANEMKEWQFRWFRAHYLRSFVPRESLLRLFRPSILLPSSITSITIFNHQRFSTLAIFILLAPLISNPFTIQVPPKITATIMSRIQALNTARCVLTREARQLQGSASISVVGQQVSSARSSMVTYAAEETDYYADNFSLEATLNQVLESQRLTSQVSDPTFEAAVKGMIKME